jgi:hypothetical protein
VGSTFSTLGNSGPLGAYLTSIEVAAAALAVLYWRELAVPTRIALFGLIMECAIALLYTLARASLLGIALGSFAVLLLAPRVTDGISRRSALIVVALLIAVIGILVPTAASPFAARIEALLVGDASTQDRVLIWRGAAELIAERPLLGLGPDNFAAAYPSVRTVEAVRLTGPDTLTDSTHSWLLRVTVDAGLAGMVAFLVMLGAAAWRALRDRTRVSALGLAVVAAYLGQGLVAIEHISTDWIPWLGLGLVASLTEGGPGSPAAIPARHRGPRARTARAQTPWLVWGAGIAALIAVTLASWQQVRASEALFRSVAALRAGDTAVAIAWANDATRLDPDRAIYWHGLGVARSTAGQQREAVQAFERAARLQPYRSDGWRNLAVAHLRSLEAGGTGAAPAAVAAAENGVAAEPNNPLAHFVLARAALAARDDERAAAASEHALAILPREDIVEVQATAYTNLSRWAEAERVVIPRLEGAPLYRLLAARIYLGTGRRELAREQLEIYLRTDPTNASALALLRRLQSPE